MWSLAVYDFLSDATLQWSKDFSISGNMKEVIGGKAWLCCRREQDWTIIILEICKD